MNREPAKPQQGNRKRLLGVLVLGVFLVAGVAIYAFPHCVPAEKLAAVKSGITRNDAVALLGQPDFTTHYDDGRSRLSYGKPARYCTVDVLVDPTDHVTGVFHDH